jgi:hypothetical protein
VRAETRVGPGVRRAAVAGALGSVGLAAVVVLIVFVVRAGGPGLWVEDRIHDFTHASGVSQSSGRFGSLNSNYRWGWWQEAWRSFEDAPLDGRGAGSFPLVHRLERTDAINVRQPHSLFLQALSDTGVVGFLLILGAIVAAVLAARAMVRGTRGPGRLAGLVLAIAAGAYVVESLVDVDWDFLATTAPTLFVVGALAAAGARPSTRSVWSLAAAGAACAAAASLLVPWLAAHKTDDAYAALDRNPAAAVRDAKQANSLNPLSVEPLNVLALARLGQGRLDDAERAYARAVRLQPDNPETWYELGSFELDTRHDRVAACAFLTRAGELDPHDSETTALRDRACA